ncbi:MAG: MauE/DoxX family redox-associated membrane protein [Dermatophilaceae bacterium]
MTVQRAQAPVAGTRPWLDILGTAARLGVGGVLVAAGALKVANLPLSAFAVRAYQLLPYELAGYVGYALPVVELLVGALLLAGLFTRWAALAASVLMAGFVVGIGWAWATGLAIDCGCFGGGGPTEAGRTAYPLELTRDALLLGLSAWLVVRPRTAYALDNALS